MLKRLRRAWTRYLLFRFRIPLVDWQTCIDSSPTLSGLDYREQQRLRELSSLFLREKTITGAAGLAVDSAMRVYIAAQACLLILNFDLDYYDGWREIIVYPDSFIVTREEYDDIGVVHETRQTLGGEAWDRGPVIVSWADAKPEPSAPGSDTNVLLHEFSHKLDMLNGVANGMPPLHADMRRQDWTEAMSQAYENLYQLVDQNYSTAIDPYAIESPAEFFAVLTEVFFEQPVLLQELYPSVYKQFVLFYRQDPLARIQDR